MHKKIYQFFHGHYHRHYNGKYHHAKKLFVVDLVLLGVALTTFVAGMFFFFWKSGLTEWIDLGLSYGNNRIKSGERVQLTLDYTNRSEKELTAVTLAVHLPPGFIIDRTLTPTEEFSEQSIFSIPNLHPGAKGEKKVYGWLWSEPKVEQEIISILSYTPEGSKRSEQKFGSFFLNLPESILKTELNFGVDSAFPKAKFPIALTLSNTEDYELKDISIEYSWAGNITWQEKLEKISFNGKETKVLNGEIEMPNKAGTYNLKIQPQIIVNNRTIKLDIISKDVTIVYPEATVSAILNTNLTYAEPGSVIPVKISWKNNSQYELKNLRIKINSTNGVVNLQETAQENNLKISGGSLMLDATNRTLLADGGVKSSGETEIKIILARTFSLGEKEHAYLEIIPTLEAELKEVSGQTLNNVGNTVRILLATNPTLSVTPRYFTVEGDQLGRGPIPPQVGQTTKYWMFVQMENTTNKLQDIAFRATLANGVEFTGKQSVTIGEPIKNQNGQLTWDAYEIPANSLTGWYFEVAITPTTEQVGQNINLVKSINITATDKETGKKFNLVENNINNILPPNDNASEIGSKVR